MHFLEREILLNAEPQRVWEFLATPINLNELTPPDLQFQLLSEVPDKMHNGLTILYEIKVPIFGKHRWLTEIKHIREGEYFVDEQRLGPYRLWYHQHRIEGAGEGKTRMRDHVSYRLPFGVFGCLVHKLRVEKMLQEIFAYRAKRLREIFV